MTTTFNAGSNKPAPIPAPAEVVAKIINIETDSQYAPDMRRVLREERFAVQGAVQSGDGARIEKAVREAMRVAKMWGVSLS